MLELVAWTYNFLLLVWSVFIDLLPFPKNLDFSKISLGKCTGIGEKSLTISATLPFDLPEDMPIVDFNDLDIKLLITTFLKEMF